MRKYLILLIVFLFAFTGCGKNLVDVDVDGLQDGKKQQSQDDIGFLEGTISYIPNLLFPSAHAAEVSASDNCYSDADANTYTSYVKLIMTYKGVESIICYTKLEDDKSYKFKLNFTQLEKHFPDSAFKIEVVDPESVRDNGKAITLPIGDIVKANGSQVDVSLVTTIPANAKFAAIKQAQTDGDDIVKAVENLTAENVFETIQKVIGTTILGASLSDFLKTEPELGTMVFSDILGDDAVVLTEEFITSNKTTDLAKSTDETIVDSYKSYICAFALTAESTKDGSALINCYKEQLKLNNGLFAEYLYKVAADMNIALKKVLASSTIDELNSNFKDFYGSQITAFKADSNSALAVSSTTFVDAYISSTFNLASDVVKNQLPQYKMVENALKDPALVALVNKVKGLYEVSKINYLSIPDHIAYKLKMALNAIDNEYKTNFAILNFLGGDIRNYFDMSSAWTSNFYKNDDLFIASLMTMNSKNFSNLAAKISGLKDPVNEIPKTDEYAILKRGIEYTIRMLNNHNLNTVQDLPLRHKEILGLAAEVADTYEYAIAIAPLFNYLNLGEFESARLKLHPTMDSLYNTDVLAAAKNYMVLDYKAMKIADLIASKEYTAYVDAVDKMKLLAAQEDDVIQCSLTLIATDNSAMKPEVNVYAEASANATKMAVVKSMGALNADKTAMVADSQITVLSPGSNNISFDVSLLEKNAAFDFTFYLTDGNDGNQAVTFDNLAVNSPAQCGALTYKISTDSKGIQSINATLKPEHY